MTDLEAVIEGVEGLDGPDREVDVLIAAALDWRTSDHHPDDPTIRQRVATHGAVYMAVQAERHGSIWSTVLPRFTASIDAALGLVPEGWGSHVTTTPDGGGAARVWENRLVDQGPGRSKTTDYREFDTTGLVQHNSWRRDVTEWVREFKHKPSGAIALCIAALRARQAQGE